MLWCLLHKILLMQKRIMILLRRLRMTPILVLCNLSKLVMLQILWIDLTIGLLLLLIQVLKLTELVCHLRILLWGVVLVVCDILTGRLLKVEVDLLKLGRNYGSKWVWRLLLLQVVWLFESFKLFKWIHKYLKRKYEISIKKK